MSAAKPGAGKRILVVEDEMLVAMLLEDILTDLGYTVVGAAGRLDDALALSRDEALDGAILDVHLNGEEVFPVADVLSRRRIPFVFATGYGTSRLPQTYRSSRTLSKPYQKDDVEKVLSALLGSA